VDAAVRKALKAELETALREREKLDVVIAYLRARVGSGSSKDPVGADLDAALISTLQRTPADAIGRGQFEGKSATKAARQVLNLFGSERPLKTQELFDALAKGGVRVKNANVLHRSLNRDDTFCRVERGLWGLSEWQSDAGRATPEDQPGGASNGDSEVFAPLAHEGEAADSG
jgi:hypothetical protein